MNQHFIPSEMHFAGHDTFHLRYTWLPKAAEFLKGKNDNSLSNYDVVMTELGLGKNMAKSLKHWAESSQLFNKNNDYTHKFSELGNKLFILNGGLDPYLEMPESNWLLHYLITSNHKKNGLWFYLFNVYNESIIIKDEFLINAINWFNNHDISTNPNTLYKDLQCCINMYNSQKLRHGDGLETTLSSPLRDLKLIQKVGENYRLRTISTADISTEIFSYCLMDYLEKDGFQKFTPFSELLNGMKSPGRIFRLSENILEHYLNEFLKLTSGYIFDSTAGMKQLIKKTDRPLDKMIILEKAYV
jgi:hypothetical protein